MDMEMLDAFTNELQPELILPIHIDDFAHFESSRLELEKKFNVLKNGESVVL